MNTFKILTAVLCCLFFVSCEYDSFEEEDALSGLTFGNQYVRLLTGGVEGMEEIVVGEDNSTATVSIQSRSTSGGAVTVSYTLGGTATYGEVYTIEGATASGGSVAIPFQDDPDNTAFAEGDIEFTFLVDTLSSGPLTIDLMLAGATNDDGAPIDVGQGPLRRQVTLSLIND